MLSKVLQKNSAKGLVSKTSYLTLCLASALITAPVLANDSASELVIDEHIEISSEKAQRAFPTLGEARAELKKVAGGTNLIEIAKLPARQATLQDALGFEPGIIMQSFFGGNDQPRLNIRGSGMQSNPVNRGVQLLQDGLPINQADGSFVIGFLDTKSANMVSVYRGANALRYGGTTLGGAVNLNSNNGESTSPSVRMEYGSDNRLGLSGQLAGQGDSWDFYVNAGHDSYDGYRNHSESKRSNLVGNFGIDITDTITNRTYFQWVDNRFEIPFVVPKGRALSSPEQVLGDGNTPLDKLLNAYNRDPFRDSTMQRLANKTRFSNDNLIQELGVFYQVVDDTFTDPLKHNVTESTDYGFEYSAVLTGDYISSHDEFLLSFSGNQSDMTREYFANSPKDGSKLQRFGNLDFDANNLILALQWQAQLSQNIQLVTAAQVVRANRDINDNASSDIHQENDYQSVNPKLGINYQLSDEVRLFANVSSTSEAPTYWELVSASVSPKNSNMAKISLNELDAQTSNTIEFGTSGNFANAQWNIAIYRSDVEDELISIVSDFAVNGKTDNYAAGTIHQGLELEWLQGISDDLFIQGDSLTSKLVYNYSDFHFSDGEYEGNQIAGVPEHLMQFEFRYQTSSGLYIAPNIKWQIEDAAIDHANSQYQDAYWLLGLQVAYQVNDDLRIYLDGQNLTNEVYQTSYVIRGYSNAKQPSYLPGFGPSVSMGINYVF
ncbi:MAG: TonB-dependent receptor [Colwellia sp.]|nr:TonB-dependent receptor [Colwellia sp.]